MKKNMKINKRKRRRTTNQDSEQVGSTKRRIEDPNWTAYSRMTGTFDHHPKFIRSCTQLIRPSNVNVNNLTDSDFFVFPIQTGKNEYRSFDDNNHLVIELDTKISKFVLTDPHASTGPNAGLTGKIRSSSKTEGYATVDTGTHGTTWNWPITTGMHF